MSLAAERSRANMRVCKYEQLHFRLFLFRSIPLNCKILHQCKKWHDCFVASRRCELIPSSCELFGKQFWSNRALAGNEKNNKTICCKSLRLGDALAGPYRDLPISVFLYNMNYLQEVHNETILGHYYSTPISMIPEYRMLRFPIQTFVILEIDLLLSPTM